MTDHVAIATIHPARPVVDRPDVPLVGECIACGWRGEQSIRIRFETDIDCLDTEATVDTTQLVCHRCEPMALEVVAEMEGGGE